MISAGSASSNSRCSRSSCHRRIIARMSVRSSPMSVIPIRSPQPVSRLTVRLTSRYVARYKMHQR